MVTTTDTEGETAETDPLASVRSEAVPDETRVELCMLVARVEANDDDDMVDVTDDKTLACVLRKGIAMLTDVVTLSALVAKALFLLILPLTVDVSATSVILVMFT